ncbi:aromatic ring hydroxylase [Petrotoga sp. 9PW.55.5.1]|jgi:metal-sulfur cluster biosynthetic enzyme|uniref:metal-sulfur cluster assembly factor n=1 Tax=Petrotoga sp. 9PW.55.5.1 TaxID=1308979 RepID=UPI000DC21337|nr:iron-sulfur cluster assembly protein [Petrotoga sp. 9PW.55.5.1]RAO98586.1 aromatic ring hydroxylase [Petrotoga sp. 9PW.55.5.1]
MPNVGKENIMDALKEVYDLEIGFDIVSLGLIYKVDVDDNNNVHILMTLTTPMCPLAGFIVDSAKEKVKEIKEVNEVEVELTFDPPWDPQMASEEVKNLLGL